MKRIRWVSATAAVMLLAALSFVFWPRSEHVTAFARASNVMEYPADEQSVTLSAPGITEPKSKTIQIISEVTGSLRQVHVGAGDRVSRGQILAELDNELQAANVEVAQAALAKARAELARIKNGDRPEEQAILKAKLDEARASLNLAHFERQRIDSMTERDVTAEREVAHAREALERASARHEAARMRWELSMLGARAEDLATAEAGVRGATAILAAANSTYQKTYLRCPIDGIVVYRYREPGEVVFSVAPQPVLTVGDRSRLHVRVDVDEVDIGRVWVGQHIFATARAYEGKRFAGRVVHIEPTLGRKNFRTNLPTERVDTKVQEVVVALDNADEIPLGLQVVVWFLARPASGTLELIPSGGRAELLTNRVQFMSPKTSCVGLL